MKTAFQMVEILRPLNSLSNTAPLSSRNQLHLCEANSTSTWRQRAQNGREGGADATAVELPDETSAVTCNIIATSTGRNYSP